MLSGINRHMCVMYTEFDSIEFGTIQINLQTCGSFIRTINPNKYEWQFTISLNEYYKIQTISSNKIKVNI